MWSWLKKQLGSSKKTQVKPQARLHLESLEDRAVPAVSPLALMQFGLSSGLSSSIAQSYNQAPYQPSILTPRYTSSQFGAQARLNNNFNDLGYVLNPAGARADFLSANGYGALNNLTITGSSASAIYNDPYIASQSGQLAYNGALNYFTDNFSYGATNLNAVGIVNSVGLGNTALNPIVGQVQAVGGFGNSRPPGTGSGSPLIDSFGPPIGTNPQDRITYPGYATVSPVLSSFGNPVGYRPADGNPLIHVNQPSYRSLWGF